MNILLGFIFIMVGILQFFFPEEALSLQDIFRIRGERQYSGFAIFSMRLGGIIAFFIGLYIMFTFNIWFKSEKEVNYEKNNT